MGLFDGILGNVVGSLTGGQVQHTQNPLGSILGGLAGGGVQGGNMLGAVMAVIQQSGGLSHVLDKFRQSGLAEQADSWVGTDANLPVSADQMHQVLGGPALQGLAAQLGLSSAQAGSAMAQVLPELVNQLTPEGRVPDDHQDLLSQAMTMLRGGGL